MAANERVVNLAVRAKDEFSKVFKSLEETGRKTQLLFARDTRKALNETQAEIQRVTREMTTLSRATGDNREQFFQLAIAKGKLIEKASTLSGNLNRVLDTVRSTKNAANGGYSAFIKMADGMDVSKAKAERLRREIQALSVDVAKSSEKQASLVSTNPFAAADSGRDANAYIQAARQKKIEMRALMLEQHKASGAVQSSIQNWFRYADTLRISDITTENVTAAVSATVPALNKKESATKRATQAEREHTAAMERTARTSHKMSGSGSTLPGARQRNQGVKGDAQEVEVWGLKPWQLTNFGYQINDVVSGLAMGQAPVQILAQQAGQFAQIWPGVMVSLARSIPIIAGTTAALAPLIAAIRSAADERTTLKEFTADLALSADGARYSAEEMTKAAMAMRNMGVEMSTARDLVSMFMKEGFDTTQMVTMTTLAKQLAEVTGTELPDAASKIAKAFSGNANSIRELDRELNFLTADQLAQIRAMDQAGNRAGALSLAQGLLKDKLADTIQPATTWQQALKDLKDAWSQLTEAVKNSGIIELGATALQLLAYSAKGSAAIVQTTANVLTGTDPNTVNLGDLDKRYRALKKQRQEMKLYLDQERAYDVAMFGENAKDSSLTEYLRKQLAEIEAEYDKVVSLIKEGNAEREESATLTKAEIAAIDGKVAATEEEKKNSADIDDLIRSQLETMENQVDTVLQTSREQFIQNALLDARNTAMSKANELGTQLLGLTEQQSAAIREQAGLLYDAQQASGFASSMGEFSDGLEASAAMIAKFEDFRATPYWDVNALRVGFGSDTITTATGEVKRVVEGMVVTVEDSVRDLNRRIREEFAPKVQSQIGADRFASFVPIQQAALLSIAYNYGELPNRIVEAVRTGTNTEIASAIQGLSGDNNGINSGRRYKEASAFSTDVEGKEVERLLEIEKERAETVKEYNEESSTRIADKQFELTIANKEARAAEIAKAIREEELAAQKAGVELTKERRDEIARLTGQLWDQQNVEAEVNRLMDQRSLILEKLELAEQSNDQVGIRAARGDLQEIDSALTTAIDKAISFWQAMGGPGSDLAIQKLQLTKDQLRQMSEEISTKYLPTAEEMNDRLADVGANAFQTLAEKAAQGKLAFQDFFQAISEGIGQFLIDIGKAIIKQAIFNAITNGQGASGGAGGWMGGMISSIFHGGGVVGSSRAPTRAVDPMIFAGAMRYHTGGISGLKPNERPVITEVGEEILTADNPRHRNNFSGKPPSVKIVNVLDPVEILEKALASEIGEKSIINFIARRSRQIKGVLG